MGLIRGVDHQPRVLVVKWSGIESVHERLPFETAEDKALAFKEIERMVRLGIDARIIHAEDG